MAMLNMMAHAPRESFPAYPPQPYSPYQARPQEPRPYASSSPDANAYSGYSAASRQQSHSSPSFPSATFGRGPPPGDAPRPSLPPISNLLGIADGDRFRNERDIPRSVSRHSHSPPSRPLWFDSIAPTSHAKHPESRSHPPAPAPPPFRHDSVEGGRSPSTISTGSTSSLPPYLASATVNKLESMDQRAAEQSQASKPAVPPAASPREIPPYAVSSYAPSAGTIPRTAGGPPSDGQSAAAEEACQQRPLPSNFPPAATSPSSVPSATSAASANSWEHHHHYIGTSSHAAFPQSQDRYICQTCNKAFSRPSSLKIHSHSHTGEKPFRCPHSGCGKAFSVRSNMKRHERGCHTGLGTSAGSTSPLM